MENTMSRSQAPVADISGTNFPFGHNVANATSRSEAITQLSEQDRKFAEFHLANPQVYRELTRLAREARSKGRVKLGIRMLWEVMRWNLTVEVKAQDGFTLNDHLHSRYARLIMQQEPDLKGLFDIRELRT